MWSPISFCCGCLDCVVIWDAQEHPRSTWDPPTGHLKLLIWCVDVCSGGDESLFTYGIRSHLLSCSRYRHLLYFWCPKASETSALGTHALRSWCGVSAGWVALGQLTWNYRQEHRQMNWFLMCCLDFHGVYLELRHTAHNKTSWTLLTCEQNQPLVVHANVHNLKLPKTFHPVVFVVPDVTHLHKGETFSFV